MPREHARATPIGRIRLLSSPRTCAFTRGTLIYYLDFARGFLGQTFGEGELEMSALRAADVIKFVQRQVAHRSRGSARKLTTGLRSFLRFARYRGYLTADLATGVPAVANWSMPSIPRSIEPPEDVRRVLAHCDRRTAVGSRDYAILLLLARLGLRASAIAFLELDDIDWGAGTLSVRGKDSHVHVLPLPIDVGKAIAAYDRPRLRREDAKQLLHPPRKKLTIFLGRSPDTTGGICVCSRFVSTSRAYSRRR